MREEQRLNKSAFSVLLIQARKEISISQANLSKVSHVSTRTIVALENEKRDTIRPDVIVRLASALSGDQQQWLTVAGFDKDALKEQIWRYPSEIEQAQIFNKFISLPGELQDKLLAAMNAYKNPPKNG